MESRKFFKILCSELVITKKSIERRLAFSWTLSPSAMKCSISVELEKYSAALNFFASWPWARIQERPYHRIDSIKLRRDPELKIHQTRKSMRKLDSHRFSIRISRRVRKKNWKFCRWRKGPKWDFKSSIFEKKMNSKIVENRKLLDIIASVVRQSMNESTILG